MSKVKSPVSGRAKSKTVSTEFVLVSANPKVVSQWNAAVGTLPTAKSRILKTAKELNGAIKEGEGFLFLDHQLPDGNPYEICRQWKGNSAWKIFVVLPAEDRYGSGIARFCGADGTLRLPLEPQGLEDLLNANFPQVKVDELLRKAEKTPQPSFAENLLKDALGQQDPDLIDAIVDPETKLFNYAFLSYKLDEEFKRAIRFKYPLSCVLLGFDGEASSEVLLDLAGMFLGHSRDTDVLGRFDLNSFLFLLPNTGLEGSRIMAKRVLAAAAKKKLKDLVGETLDLSVGIAYCPHTGIVEREDLFEAAHRAFESARSKGGGIEIGDGKA